PLDVAVDRQLHVAAGLRFLPCALTPERDAIADAVTLEVDGARNAAQLRVEIRFDPRKSRVVAPDKPEQVRRDVTLRIEALRRLHQANPRRVRFVQRATLLEV